jgi:hypothetical protein
MDMDVVRDSRSGGIGNIDPDIVTVRFQHRIKKLPGFYDRFHEVEHFRIGKLRYFSRMTERSHQEMPVVIRVKIKHAQGMPAFENKIMIFIWFFPGAAKNTFRFFLRGSNISDPPGCPQFIHNNPLFAGSECVYIVEGLTRGAS